MNEVTRKAREILARRGQQEYEHEIWRLNRDPAADDLEHWRSAMPQPEPVPEPELEPQKELRNMSPETQVAWDKWVKAHIRNALAEDWKSTKKVLDGLCAGMGTEVGKIINGLNKKIAALEEEVGQLRADLSVQRTLVKDEVKRDVT
jgi:hypothetical protein